MPEVQSPGGDKDVDLEEALGRATGSTIVRQNTTHQQVAHLLMNQRDRVEIVGAIRPITVKLRFARDKRPTPTSLCPCSAFLYRLVLRFQFDEEFALKHQHHTLPRCTHMKIKNFGEVGENCVIRVTRDDAMS